MVNGLGWGRVLRLCSGGTEVIRRLVRIRESGVTWVPACAGMTEGGRGNDELEGAGMSEGVSGVAEEWGVTWVPAPDPVRGRLCAGMTEGRARE